MSSLRLLTCFVKETRWVPTRREDALRIISEEMGGADPEGILAYVLEATKEGKTVTVGECRFRQEATGGGPSPSS
ncbi:MULTISPECIES: hypothetical protein [Sulfurimonas]|uniref:Uncharacterized protein n=1 Tax=Sulfurimonas diazotrophicus TaxID=3131939 RepID=A0ABZ3H845_9BACT